MSVRVWSVQIYVAKHARERKGEWVSGNLVFFRMHRISDIYFVGGFGTVQWVDVADYIATKPDSIVAADPQQTISVRQPPFLLFVNVISVACCIPMSHGVRGMLCDLSLCNTPRRVCMSFSMSVNSAGTECTV